MDTATTKSPLEDSCPRGPEHCPIYQKVEDLRAERDHLLDQTQIDPLTGLYNYRFLMVALEREMERTRRTGSPTSIIMIDLDHFKQLNDLHGHQTGNQVLKLLAMYLRDNIRKFDLACRYGGEEFTLILPGSRRSQAVQVAERLRTVVEQSCLDVHDQKIQLTASFGVDTFEGRESLTPGKLIERADKYLYEAKKQGRNRSFTREDIKTDVSSKEKAALDFEF